VSFETIFEVKVAKNDAQLLLLGNVLALKKPAHNRSPIEKI